MVDVTKTPIQGKLTQLSMLLLIVCIHVCVYVGVFGPDSETVIWLIGAAFLCKCSL